MDEIFINLSFVLIYVLVLMGLIILPLWILLKFFLRRIVRIIKKEWYSN